MSLTTLICPYGCGDVEPREGWVHYGNQNWRAAKRALVCPECNARLLPTEGEIEANRKAAAA